MRPPIEKRRLVDTLDCRRFVKVFRARETSSTLLSAQNKSAEKFPKSTSKASDLSSDPMRKGSLMAIPVEGQTSSVLSISQLTRVVSQGY